VRIAWVHPSWRDLVIDELAVDATARARFLAAVGVHGAVLALSTGGGAHGERRLPLLVTDADWDALGDRVHALASELDASDHARLLDAVTAALHATVALHDPRRSEALALGHQVLERAVRLWSHADRPLEVDLLGSWYRLADAVVDARPAAPDLARTWAALLPASAELDGPSELDRVDAWLALCEVLAVHDRAALARLGFPERHSALLIDLATALGAACAVDDPRPPPAVSALARLARLMPDAVAHVPVVEDAPWDPLQAPSPQPPPRLDPSVDVDRILRDLA
jgi:hypothetical protein